MLSFAPGSGRSRVRGMTYGACVSSFRFITSLSSRGQFSPIHDFKPMLDADLKATSEKEFSRMIRNPGPLQVGFSADYWDWLWRAYQNKVKARELGGNNSDEKARYPLMLKRLEHSFRRKAAERRQQHAQTDINTLMCRHGVLDLFERQPQFPVIHLNTADRSHIVELFKEIVLDHSLEPQSIWDTALLYQAVLQERRQSYPKSFDYIFEALENVALSTNPKSVLSPTQDGLTYFLYLVKKYHIENAIEAHVVLRCHREPHAGNLLFSVPPPKDDADVMSAIGTVADDGSGTTPVSASKKVPRPPAEYPPIEALWRCEENFPLLLVLVFAELNLNVSENPFIKFPNAFSFVMRRYSTEGERDAGQQGSVSLSAILQERRGNLFSSFPKVLSNALDARGGDIHRLKLRFHREDIATHERLTTGKEAGLVHIESAYFNPRTFRAEKREAQNVKLAKALKDYRQARDDIYRKDHEEADHQQAVRQLSAMLPQSQSLPSIPSYLCAIQRDPHVSFLLSVCDPQAADVLEKSTLHLADALYRQSLVFHKEHLRRLNHQKVQIAAALVDDDVATQLQEIKGSGRGHKQSVATLAHRLGQYRPFANRPLDASGSTTDARMDDYRRWMRPPADAGVGSS